MASIFNTCADRNKSSEEWYEISTLFYFWLPEFGFIYGFRGALGLIIQASIRITTKQTKAVTSNDLITVWNMVRFKLLSLIRVTYNQICCDNLDWGESMHDLMSDEEDGTLLVRLNIEYDNTSHQTILLCKIWWAILLTSLLQWHCKCTMVVELKWFRRR